MSIQNQDNWTEMKAKIRNQWNKFTEAELDSFKGNLDKLLGQIQKTYGVAKEQAEKEFSDFKRSIQARSASHSAPQGPKPSLTLFKKNEARASEGGKPGKRSEAV